MILSPWFDSNSDNPVRDGVYAVKKDDDRNGFSYWQSGLFYGIWSSKELAYTMKFFFFKPPLDTKYFWRGIAKDE